MSPESSEEDQLVERAAGGDRQALAELFSLFEERLRMFVLLRMDRRLHRRIDCSDVLQEAFMTISNRFQDYVKQRRVSPYVWIRTITGQTLVDLHRRHLGATMRSARKEISLHNGTLPQASSVSLARFLVGQLTSPSIAASRAELQVQLQEALNSLSEMDREIVALRHFEELRNGEVAELLQIDKSTATKRYIRAIRRLKDVLSKTKGFDEKHL